MSAKETPEGYVARRSAEAREEYLACLRGDCVYACPRCRPLNHKSGIRIGCESQHGCMGYVTRMSIEAGKTVFRTGSCPHFQGVVEGTAGDHPEESPARARATPER